MERVVHIAKSFEEAEEWDIKQQLEMTPQERIWVARDLQRKVYGPPKDIRACHRND